MVGLQTPTMTGADTVAKNESLNAAAKAKVLSRWRGLAEPVEYLHDQGELLSLYAEGQEPVLNAARRKGTLRSRREGRRVARSASSILAGARNWGALDQLSPLTVSSSSTM